MILVTGGAGFIGATLVTRLARHGERVRVLDDFSTGRRERLAGLDVEVVAGDVADPGAVREAVAGAESVVHLAANASVPRCEEEPEAAARTNVAGTLEVIAASREYGVSALVYASSCAVYGDGGGRVLSEEAPLRPASVYAATKLAGERHVVLAHRAGGPSGVALRFFNVYGPGQPADFPYSGVLARFRAAARAAAPPEIHGDGGQTRDFVHVADVVEAVRLALVAAPGPARGGVFNIGAGRSASVLEVWGLVAAAAGVEHLEPRFAPLRAGDVRHASANVDRAAQVLGFRARTPLEEGILGLVGAARILPEASRPAGVTG